MRAVPRMMAGEDSEDMGWDLEPSEDYYDQYAPLF